MRRVWLLLSLVLALVVPRTPSAAQPVPEGDEVRVREDKKAPWMQGMYVRHDSTSLTMTEDGIERVYELAALQRVDWHKQNSLAGAVLKGAGGGALVALLTGAIICSGDDDYFDCSDGAVAQATALSAAMGAGLGLVLYAVQPRSWKKVTKHYPPAGMGID